MTITLRADQVDTGIRVPDRASIRAFVEKHKDRLATGRVLDFGCGKQPYRDLVAGEYVGFDRAAYPSNVSEVDYGPDNPLHRSRWDAILCNQVTQYHPDVRYLIQLFRGALVKGGALVMTYATCWAEVEPADHWRFTKTGMETLFTDAKFTIADHELRLAIDCKGFVIPIGYGVLAIA